MPNENIPSELRATESAWRTAAAACRDKVTASEIVFLSGAGGGWVDSSVQVVTGQTVTLLATGQVWLSREANLAFPPSIALWYRIADGPIARCISNTGSSSPTARASFRSFPNRRANGPALREISCRTIRTPVLREVFWSRFWRGLATPTRASKDLPRATSPALPRPNAPGAPKRNRFRADGRRCGASATPGCFAKRSTDGRTHIACRCDNDAAILKYPVDVPLKPDTHLAWSWRIERLPSEHPENILPHHDYCRSPSNSRMGRT